MRVGAMHWLKQMTERNEPQAKPGHDGWPPIDDDAAYRVLEALTTDAEGASDDRTGQESGGGDAGKRARDAARRGPAAPTVVAGAVSAAFAALLLSKSGGNPAQTDFEPASLPGPGGTAAAASARGKPSPAPAQKGTMNAQTASAATAALIIAGTAAAQGAPTEWATGLGGNGHWYALARSTSRIPWATASQEAASRGGHLATLNVPGENEFVFAFAQANDGWSGLFGPWLGGRIDAGSSECDPGSWRWVTDEPWLASMAAWCPGQPDCGGEVRLHYWHCTAGWNNGDADGDYGWGGICTYLIEWDADCNDDGIVDYGQIIQGRLADANGNGIPDSCEQPTCGDADVYANGRVDGADLAALLSEWGPVQPTTRSDLTHDGKVDGADLSVMLSFWGPCGG